MRRHQLVGGARTTTAAAALAVGLAPAAITSASAATAPAYRQLIGTVSSSTYLEASVPKNGNYAIEYDIVSGTAFFDTYLKGIELGYVGGSAGSVSVTKKLWLRAGGQLVQVAGPEGSGTARVFIVSRG